MDVLGVETNTNLRHFPVTKDYGETRIYFHSATFSNSSLVLNSSFFPGVEKGDVIYLLTDKSEKPQIYLEVTEPPTTKSTVAISIQEKLGHYLNLSPQQIVQVGSCSRDSTELKLVEVTIVDGCLPRQEMWSLLESLQSQFVYVKQRLMIEECEIEISNLTHNGLSVSGGLITPSTDVLFYRTNCRMYVVVHITREILAVDASGYLRSEIVTDFCFKKILDLWKQGNTHHIVTILLYTDLDMIHQGRVFPQRVPFIKVLCKDRQDGFDGVRTAIKRFVGSIRPDLFVFVRLSILAPFHSIVQALPSRPTMSVPTLFSFHSSRHLAVGVLLTAHRSQHHSEGREVQQADLTLLGEWLAHHRHHSFRAHLPNHRRVLQRGIPPLFECVVHTRQSSRGRRGRGSRVCGSHLALQSAVIQVCATCRFFSRFYTPNGAFSTQSVVSGFMPAIFYSIEKNGEIGSFSVIVDFIQSIDLKDFKGNTPRLQEHLRGLYSQCSLLKQVFQDLPPSPNAKSPQFQSCPNSRTPYAARSSPSQATCRRSFPRTRWTSQPAVLCRPKVVVTS